MWSDKEAWTLWEILELLTAEIITIIILISNNHDKGIYLMFTIKSSIIQNIL